MGADEASSKDFFISYNSADRAWAEWIAWQLEEDGYTTVIQAWDFRAGSNFVLDMQQATAQAERTIAVLSPDYLTARFTQPEWAAAFAQDPTGEKGTLLPVRVRECDLKGLLPQIVYVDFVGRDEDKARETLLAAARRERAKPTVAPRFPRAAARAVAGRPPFPGVLPPVWNVPHHRNLNFTGREELLAGLRAGLSAEGRTAVTQAISGLGGVGKTQLALEYAYRHSSDYSIVWWVRAEEPAKLAADYAGLATAIELPEREAVDQTAVVEAVRRWLEQNHGWLLVFDNAREPDEIREYVPRGSAGHIIATSRNPNWSGLASPLPVEVLKRAASVVFLLKRTGQDDEGTADALADALGDLPLALEQAGAYVEASAMPLGTYLGLFRERAKDMLSRGQPATDYPHTVATTWEMSFEGVQRESEAAADLLNLCAFLAPDDIPLDIIRDGAEHLPQPLAAAVGDSLAFSEGLAVLRRYSLAEVSQDALSLHRLVQAVARDRLGQGEQKAWAEAAVHVVDDAFPFDSDDVRTWPQCSRLLAHALAAAGHAEARQIATDPTARLLNQVGLYLRERARLGEAKGVLERALAIGEAAYGPDHPLVAAAVNNLGLVLWDLGDPERARAHFQRVLAMDERAYGLEHPMVAKHARNLSAALRDVGDLPGALAQLERALAIDEKAYGPDHPEVASDLSGLAVVLRDVRNHAGARTHAQRALAIDEAAYGPTHPAVARDVGNLAAALRDLGDLPGALAQLERAVAIDEKAYGPDHPEVATDVNNLGVVLRDLGDLGGARAHFERALAIRRDCLGEHHPRTVLVRENLESLSGFP